MKETHMDIIMQRKIPGVGHTVRSKKHGSLWRIIEKKEIWLNASDDPQTGKSHLQPAIQLTFWQVRDGVQQGIGKMLGHAYTLHDNTFEADWELIHEN